MLYYWYGNKKIQYKRCNNLRPLDIMERIVTRLYGISFGNEEYFDSGFSLSGGITVILEDDDNLEKSLDVEVHGKTITFKRNKALSNNKCWWSLVDGNKEIKDKLMNLLETKKD